MMILKSNLNDNDDLWIDVCDLNDDYMISVTVKDFVHGEKLCIRPDDHYFIMLRYFLTQAFDQRETQRRTDLANFLEKLAEDIRPISD